MEVTNITGAVPQSKVRYEAVKQLPIDKQRFEFFKGEVYAWGEDTRAESDTHVYWASTAYTPKWNNKTGLYLKRDSGFGCTYEKATKKFKWWYGKQAITNGHLLVTDMCKYFKAEWFTNSPMGLQISTTNSTLNKVLTGKITNPRDLIKGIIKANPTLRGMNISTELLWQFVNTRTNTRIQSLCDRMSVAKDPNHAIQYFIDNEFAGFELSDTIKQALMLNRKIDFKWSTKRMAEVHSEWTHEIMDLEQEYIEKIEYGYINEPPHNGCLELITNSKDLYIEGRMMSHCVYTNYASSVANKTYFVFKFTDRDTRATLSVSKNFNGNNFIVNQFYGKHNKYMDQCHHDFVNEWVARPDVQQWFKDNHKVSEQETLVENLMWV
jgi:hypothetical protein